MGEEKNSVVLAALDAADYDFWSTRSVENYIQDKMRANDYTRAEAEEIGRGDFARLLPQGLETPDHHLRKVLNQGRQIVGYVWLCLRGEDKGRRAFIYDIVIEEEFRGQGYGRAAMMALEELARDYGARKIGLHVFGFNERAIGLYQSLQYQVTDLVMDKVL